LTNSNIAGLLVEPGKRISSTIVVSEMPAHKVELPIKIISGAKRGPTLVITAGIHGSEYCAIVAAYTLARKINPEDVCGNVVILPLVNIAAFEGRVRAINPIDGLNLNRVFPGKREGSISYQIAYAVFNHVILKADAYVDMHGGDLMESLIPYIAYSATGNRELDRRSEDMAKAFGIKYLWKTPEATTKGGDTTEGGPWSTKGIAFAEAAAAGIPSILAEAGEDGKLDMTNVDLLCNGVMNVMKSLNMMEGKPNVVVKPVISEKCVFISAKRGGVFYSYAKAGDIANEGQILGEIKTLEGEVVEKVIAPFKGVLLAVVNNPAVKIGDDLYELMALP
jgi:predicted deacylase